MFNLESAFLSTRSSAEVAALLRVVLTPQEIKAFQARWKACQMSFAGVPQREISRTLRIGLATATRSAKAARENKSLMRRLVGRVAAKE